MNTIDRPALIDEVTREMREALESGRYAVGDKFATEYELSSQLRVGRSTVREALRVLQTQGWLELKKGRGAFVRRVQVDSDEHVREWFMRHEFQLLDFIEVRAALEPFAVRLCIERADEAEVARLGDLLAEFEIALAEGNVTRLAETDEALHSAIAEASHNRLLEAVQEIVSEAFREYRRMAFSVRDRAKNALGPHQRIVEAIQRRDVDSAASEMLQHLDTSRRDIHAVAVSRNTILANLAVDDHEPQGPGGSSGK